MPAPHENKAMASDPVPCKYMFNLWKVATGSQNEFLAGEMQMEIPAKSIFLALALKRHTPLHAVAVLPSLGASGYWI